MGWLLNHLGAELSNFRWQGGEGGKDIELEYGLRPRCGC